MERYDTIEPQPEDAGLSDSISESLDDLKSSVCHEIRTARVLDYQAACLEKEDPLEATVGALNGGLLMMANDLEERIMEVLRHSPAGLQAITPIIMSTLDMHLRMTRQIDRLAQFEVRASEIRKRFTAVNTKSADPLQAHAAAQKRRNRDSIPTRW